MGIFRGAIFLDKEELNTLYNYQIPKNDTVVKLIDMNGNEYEKTVQEAGSLEKDRDLLLRLYLNPTSTLPARPSPMR